MKCLKKLQINDIWRNIFKEGIQQALFSSPFRIVGIEVDSLTGKAIFSIKVKKISTPIKIPTIEMIEDDHYLAGLSAIDRKKVVTQYKLEIKRSLAYIFEYPLPNKEESLIFKILLLEKKHIVSGTAQYFIEKRQDIINLLSKKDIFTLSRTYFEYKNRKENSFSILKNIPQTENH